MAVGTLGAHARRHRAHRATDASHRVRVPHVPFQLLNSDSQGRATTPGLQQVHQRASMLAASRPQGARWALRTALAQRASAVAVGVPLAIK